MPHGDSEVKAENPDQVKTNLANSPSSNTKTKVEELVSRSIAVIELIIQDEKYRLKTKESKEFIQRLLLLLDKVSVFQSRKSILQIICHLAGSAENRAEVGNSAAFKKVLDLLSLGETELTKEILKTLRHFLETSDSDSLASTVGDQVNNMSSSTDNNPNLSLFINDDKEENQKITLQQSLANIPGVVAQLSKQAFNDILSPPARLKANTPRHNSKSGSTTPKQSGSLTPKRSGSVTPKLVQKTSSFLNSDNSVSMDDSSTNQLSKLAHNLQSFAEKKAESSLLAAQFPIPRSIFFRAEESFASGIWKRSSQEIIDSINSENASSEDSFKESMRIQGVLKLLTDSIGSADIEVQLELIETIAKLLLRNYNNQCEFLKIGGYGVITVFLSKIHLNQDILEKCFNRFFSAVINICIDGNHLGNVGNMQCFSWLLSLISQQHDANLYQRILSCINEILLVNPLNALHIRKLGGVDALFDLLGKNLESLHHCENYPNRNQEALVQKNICSQICSILKYVAGAFTYVDHSIAESFIHMFLTHPMGGSSFIMESISQLARHFHNFGQDLEFQEEFLLRIITFLRNMCVQNFDGVSANEEFYCNTIELLAHVLLHSKNSDVQIDFFIEREGFKLLNDCINKQPSVVVFTLLLHVYKLVLRTYSDVSNIPVCTDLLNCVTSGTFSIEYRMLILGIIFDLLRSKRPQSTYSECKFLEDLKQDNGFQALIRLIKEDDPEISLAAFHVFSQGIYCCNSNKAYIGEKIGFLDLAKTFQSRSGVLTFDEYFFEVIFDLATNCETPYSSSTSLVVLKMLELPKILDDRMQRLESDNYAIHSPNMLFENKGRKSCRIAGNHLTAGNSQNASLRSPSPLPILRHVASEPVIHSSDSTDDLHARLKFPFPKLKPLNVKSATTSESEQNESSDSIHNSASMDLEDAGQKTQTSLSPDDSDMVTKIKLLNTDAALMLILLLPNASEEIQRNALSRLSLLFTANPANIKLFSEMHVFSYLLRMIPGFPDSLHNAYFQLIALIGLYDVTHQEVKLLFDLASLNFNPYDNMNELSFNELKMQIFYVIGRLAEKFSPNTFFNLSGIGFPLESLQTPPISRFPTSSKGYSVLFWFRISKFLGKRIAFFSLGDHENEFSLSLQLDHSEKHSRFSRQFSLTLSKSDCIQIPSLLEENQKWRMFAIVQNRASLCVYLDANLIFQLPNANYPNQVSRNRPLLGRFGTNDFNTMHDCSPLCGQVGNMMLLEGVLESKMIESVFNQGPSYVGPVKVAGTEMRKIVNLDPSDPILKISKKNERLGSLLVSPKIPSSLPSIQSDKLEFLVSHSPASSSFFKPETLGVTPTFYDGRASSVSEETSFSDQSTNFPYFDFNSNPHIDSVSSCELHFVRSLRDEIRKIGGPFLCLQFLIKSNNQQINAIRILGLLLEKCDENQKIFEIGKGFEMMSFLLQSFPASSLNMEIFDLLFDLMCSSFLFNGHIPTARLFQKPVVLIMILDLLRVCEVSERPKVISVLSDLVSENPHNKEIWKQIPGIFGTMDLLRISTDCISSILSILDNILKECDPDDVEKMLSYLVIIENELLTEKALICDLFRKCLYRRHILLQHLIKIDGFIYLFALLSSPNEATLLNAIKIIGICINEGPKTKAQFLRYQGCDVMLRLLSSCSFTNSICGCLLKLALGEFCLKVESSISPSDDYIKEAKHTPHIVMVDVLKIPLLLLSNVTDYSMHILFFDYIEALLENAQNIETLLQSDWIQWCQNYYENLEQLTDDLFDPKTRRRVLSKLLSIVQKMFLYDMSLKNVRFVKLKDLVEAEDFQVLIIGSVLEYLEMRPFVEESTSSHFLRNLVQLYEHVEEIVGLTPEICVRIINSINLMASQNNDIIRTQMKDNGIFELRDNLVLHFIRNSTPPYEGLFDAFNNLSLETVAAHPKFRSSQGALYILKIFLETNDFALKVLLAEVLREQLGEHEENKRELIKVIFDLETLILLFRDIDAEDFQAANINQASCFSSSNESALSFDPSAFNFDSDDYSDSDFVSWYFLPSKKSEGRLF